MCGTKYDITNVTAPELPFSDEDKEIFMQQIYLGIINKQSLDVGIYAHTVSYLMGAVREGFKGLKDDFTFGSGLSDVSLSMESNIYRFSAAKQYQQVSIMSKLAFKAVDYKDFEAGAGLIFDDFNKNYLRTEYTTAVQQSQNARDWVDLTANEFISMLRYHTEKDPRVRQGHRDLDGITLPKDDPFWSSYYPANGWNCRCFVEGMESGKKTDLDKRDISEFGNEDFPDEFKYNPGKDGLVFSDKHPYFKVSRGDADLKRNNFNLPIP